eukprot:364581-Chlamydomonas_euryale.AAC.6
MRQRPSATSSGSPQDSARCSSLKTPYAAAPAGVHHRRQRALQGSPPGRAPGCQQWGRRLSAAQQEDAGLLRRHRGVVRKVETVDHQARQDPHANLGLSVQPPGQGLRRKDVPGWREGALLTHNRLAAVRVTVSKVHAQRTGPVPASIFSMAAYKISWSRELYALAMFRNASATPVAPAAAPACLHS